LGTPKPKNYVVSFEQGPWDAQLGYQSIRDNTGSKLLSNSLADIGYTFGAVTIKATRYQGSFGKCSQNTLGGNCQTKALSIATTGVATAATYAPIGTPYGDNFAANGLGVSVQVTPKTRAALQFTAVDDKNSARADNQVRMVTAFADYKFSKRTSVYALVSHVDNRGTANYSPIFSVPAQAPSTGTNITAYGFGLRTSF
jgi:predicted porin